MTYIMVDVEADGPCPGEFNMIEVAAINCDDPTDYFTAKLNPVVDTGATEFQWERREAALKSISRTWEEVKKYPDAGQSMKQFYAWLKKLERAGKNPMFISDNNGFDWQFVNYYFWYFGMENPFGHSSTNLNSLYKGYVKNVRKNCKHLRKTRHSHAALDDAMGNVEAFNAFRKNIGA